MRTESARTAAAGDDLGAARAGVGGPRL